MRAGGVVTAGLVARAAVSLRAGLARNFPLAELGIDSGILMHRISHSVASQGFLSTGGRAMGVENFGRLLHEAKLSKNDKEWFPRWIRRYACSVEAVEGKLPVNRDDVIRFLRSLLKNQVPAWQRLQAVRAIEAYRNLVLRTEVPSLEFIRQTLSRLADQERATGAGAGRPGVEDERHLIGQIDPNEPAVIQKVRKEMRVRHKALAVGVSVAPDGQRSAVGENPPPSRVRRLLRRVLQAGGGPGGDRQERRAAFVAAQFCDASAGGRCGHPHRAGVARTQGRADDDDLSARDEQAGAGGEEPGGRIELAGH